jgi:hypothetical protein
MMVVILLLVGVDIVRDFLEGWKAGLVVMNLLFLLVLENLYFPFISEG